MYVFKVYFHTGQPPSTLSHRPYTRSIRAAPWTLEQLLPYHLDPEQGHEEDDRDNHKDDRGGQQDDGLFKQLCNIIGRVFPILFYTASDVNDGQ